MSIILQTPRLLLREFELTDAEAMFKLNEHWDVIRYTGDPPFNSVEDATNFLSSYSDYERNGFGRWPVIVKESNEFVGWCGLKRHDDGMVDIGFRFFKKDWGKGYATESAVACIEYGFDTLKIPEIVGRVARKNVASIRVLKKLGMTYWKDAGCEGIDDSVWYRVTAD